MVKYWCPRRYKIQHCILTVRSIRVVNDCTIRVFLAVSSIRVFDLHNNVLFRVKEWQVLRFISTRKWRRSLIPMENTAYTTWLVDSICFRQAVITNCHGNISHDQLNYTHSGRIQWHQIWANTIENISQHSKYTSLHSKQVDEPVYVVYYRVYVLF